MSISKEHIMTHHWIKAEIVGNFDKRNQFNLIKCLGTSLCRHSRHFSILHLAFKRNHLSSYLTRVVLSNSASISRKATLTSDIQMYTSLRWDEKLFSPWINNSRAKATNAECILKSNWYFHSLKWFNFLLRGALDANIDTMGQFIIKMGSGCIPKCNNFLCFFSSAFLRCIPMNDIKMNEWKLQMMDFRALRLKCFLEFTAMKTSAREKIFIKHLEAFSFKTKVPWNLWMNLRLYGRDSSTQSFLFPIIIVRRVSWVTEGSGNFKAETF